MNQDQLSSLWLSSEGLTPDPLSCGHAGPKDRARGGGSLRRGTAAPNTVLKCDCLHSLRQAEDAAEWYSADAEDDAVEVADQDEIHGENLSQDDEGGDA